MTFTEAAIEVLRREGKPLHFKKIAEIAVRENLLDHVGKVPEETLAGQLAAHCRLPRGDRRMLPVEQGTFALVEWGFDEHPDGLENLVEPPPEDELPYRGRERHPVPSRELARGAGRGEARGRRREEAEERRAKRFPPPAEVAYEILAGAGRALGLAEIAVEGAERLLMPDAFVRDAGALAAALREDNRRREGAGRKPLFQLEGEQVTLVAQPEPGERAAAPAPRAAAQTATELRRAALAALRRRLRECDGATVEHLAARLLERLGYRDIKVAKRGREHVIYTARKRMGLADVRHCVRILRSGADAGRRDVTDLRRDVGHYGAQVGIVLTAGEAAREARGDAGAAGQLPVVLLCGEALAEAFADAGVGTSAVVVPEIDEAFFRQAVETAAQEEAARRARREERDRREGREGREERGGREEREPREPRERREPAAAEERPAAERGPIEVAAFSEEPSGASPQRAPVVEVEAGAGASAEEDEGEGEGEGEGEEIGGEEEGEAEGPEVPTTAAAGAEGARPEGRRRRRRRRRRGGRGRSREGSALQQADAGAAAGAPPSDANAASAPAEPPPAREAPPEPTSGSGGGGGPPAA